MSYLVEFPDSKIAHVADIECRITIYPDRFTTKVYQTVLRAFERGYIDKRQGQAAALHYELMGGRNVIRASDKAAWANFIVSLPMENRKTVTELGQTLSAWLALASNSPRDHFYREGDTVSVTCKKEITPQLLEVVFNEIPRARFQPDPKAYEAFAAKKPILITTTRRGQ